MPPRLVHGSPAGQRKGLVPPVRYICQCHQCIHSSSIDPVTLEPVKGRYVGYEEYKKHRRLENKSGLAPATASAGTLQGDLPAVGLANPPASHLISFTASTSQSPYGSTEQGRPPSKLNDTFRIKLDKIFDSLDETSVADVFDGAKLVFHFPPPRDGDQPHPYSSPDPEGRTPVHCEEINSGPYALSNHVPSNSKIIGYEEWLFESHRVITQHGLSHRDVHARLRSRVVLTRIEENLGELEELKRREWDRQRVACDAVEQEETLSVDPGQNYHGSITSDLIDH